MPKNLPNLIFALFILSLLSERVAEWLKFQRWFKWVFKIKNTTLKLPSAKEEQNRYFRILKINIAVSIVVALIIRADLFYMLEARESIQLGWPDNISDLYPSGGFIRYCKVVLGCICTGFFLSFGSKLWHDLLDIVLAFKEAKQQVVAGFPVNNPSNFGILNNAEKEAAIKGAIETFGSNWQNTIDGFAGVGLGKKTIGNEKTQDLVLEFYVEKKKENLADITNPVPAFVNYGGINIPTDVKERSEEIRPQWINPGGDHTPPRPGESISRINQQITGTMSLKMEKQEPDGSTGFYVLSCYHVLFGIELINGIREVKPGTQLKSGAAVITPGTDTSLPGDRLANARYGLINDFVDAAVAALNDEDDLDINVDELGEPENIYSVSGKDVNMLRVNFCGARSGKRTGIAVTACNQTRPYKFAPNHFLKDLIELERCSEEGDSGAPVMDNNRNLIGIIIGADKTRTYVVPIQNIINNLKVFPHLKSKNN